MARERGHGFDVPPWWLELALDKLGREKGLKALGVVLAALVDRKKPWGHEQLSRTASGGSSPTQELARAISLHYGIPIPFVIARSRAEAEALKEVREGFEKSTKILDAVRSGTEAKYKAAMGELEDQVKRHPPALNSRDEATRRSGSRGLGRVRNGGKTPSRG